jgi:hypothetical protein
MLPPTGGAVAALESDKEGLFPVFDFDRTDPRLPDLKDYYQRAKELSDKYAKLAESIPDDFAPDSKIVVQANAETVGIAREAFVMAVDADLKIKPAIADSGGAMIPETLEFKGEPVQLNTQTGALIDESGNVVASIGEESAHDFVIYDLAEERLNNLNNVLAVEYEKQPIYEKDRQTYLQQKREELTLQLDAIDRQYKFEITNIRADPDLSFEQRNDMITALYDRTNKDLRKAVESTITDGGVRRFTYLIPEEEDALLELIDQRSRTDAYDEITSINSRILAIVYPDAGIGTYYEQLRVQNMPMSIK